MNEPLVSIIIPVYNSAKHLEDCIKSALQQTWHKKEIIIIDDGSTDVSYLMAKKYESDFVRVFQQSNMGASAARNYGLKVAKGDYIQFLDADDFLEKDKIKLQIDLLQNYPNYVCFCKTIFFKNSNYKDLTSEIFMKNVIFDNPVDFLIKLLGNETQIGMVQTNAWLTPKSVIDKAGPWNEKLSVDDDGEYFCRVLLASRGICYTSKAINYYRQYDGGNSISLSNQLNFKGYESMLSAIDLKYEHLSGKIKEEQLNHIFLNHYQQVVIATFPKYNQLYKLSLNKAKKLGLKNIEYYGGPLSNILSKFLGWKITRLINYIRFGF